ncbi:MAG TPA: cache domain-containing protein [Bryobacteraceae bacterium]|jgi:hypothetical protein|nr:cache domain-containing protein [Bryobacteraceae bacterium]
MDRLEVKVSITKLLVSLLIVIVPLSVIGLILTERADKSLDDSIGNNFKTMAQLYSNQVSQFVTERVSDVKRLSADPLVIAAAAGTKRAGANAKPNLEPQPASTGAGAAKTAPAGTVVTPAVLGSSASQLLRQQKDLDPRFLWVVATNANGDVVAASQRPPMPSYSHDEFWQSVSLNKGQSAMVSDILYDDFTKSYYANIGFPILDTASGRSVGVLNAAVNMTQLLAMFQAPMSSGARAVLVNDNGLIVSGPSSDVFAHVKSVEFDAVRDSLGSLEGRQSGWQLTSLANGSYIVAFAGTGLKQAYDKLGWFVMISQDEHQAAAPIRGLEHFAVIMVALALFMLVLLCVYYFLHRAQRFEDIEDVVPAGESRSAAASM